MMVVKILVSETVLRPHTNYSTKGGLSYVFLSQHPLTATTAKGMTSKKPGELGVAQLAEGATVSTCLHPWAPIR